MKKRFLLLLFASVILLSLGACGNRKNSEKSITGAEEIPGATSDSYVPSTTTEGVTYYYCVVTNTLNGTTKTKTSGIATITVTDAPVNNGNAGISIDFN